MKLRIMKLVPIAIIAFLFFSANLLAQREVKSTGIGLRGTYWKMANDPAQIIIKDSWMHTSVNTGTGGGWLYLLSRLNENTLLELSLGAVGKVEEETFDYTNSDVDVFAVTPILLGLRLELVSPESYSALKPYLSLGAGPYWFSTVQVENRLYEETVTIETELKRGGYLGGGVNFLLSDWFAINFDVKYHFIEFNKKHGNSGYEYGLGCSFFWGRFRSR